MTQRILCDAKAGELIFCYDHSNSVAKDFIQQILELPFYQENHVEIIESMDEKLKAIGLVINPDIPLSFTRLRIPYGQELYKINWLFQLYNKLCYDRLYTCLHSPELPIQELEKVAYSIVFQPKIVTNSYYTMASTPTETWTFSKFHYTNLQLININKNEPIIPKKKVLIIDSGISNNPQFNIIAKKSFLSKEYADDVADETGHGTAIASIINDVLPETELLIYKIFDKTKFATEWDLLAALCVKNDASVINVSISYGLADNQCNKCGRLTEEARSIVLDSVIEYLCKTDKIVVAAAGNKNITTLSYPARLNNCVAIMSINSNYEISDFSNRSTIDQLGNAHPLVFLAPGGNQHPPEMLFTDYIKTSGLGTSFAVAYASAIICGVWSKNESLSASELLQRVKNEHVHKDFSTYTESSCGNGLLVF